MRGALLCAALAAALWPSHAGAQSLLLSETDAVARLNPDNARVRAIRAPVDIARADIVAAARLPNPRLSVERQSVAGVTEYYTSVTQALPITGRRGLEIQAATALASAQASRADDDTRRLRADLRLAFADLVAAQRRERELSAARDRLTTLSDVIGRRERAGDAAGFDRLRAEREALDVESDLAVAATDRARAQAMLAGFLSDVPEPSRVVAVAEEPGGAGPVDPPSIETLLEQAERTRGAIAAFQRDADAAQLASRAADRRRIPEPEIVAGTKSSTVGTGTDAGGAVTVGSGAIGPLIGVQASLAVFDRGRADRAIAAARAREAEARLAAFRTTLRGDVAALRAAVLQRRSAAERYRREAISRAAQIERIAQVSYDAGERGILELLDAFRLTASARLRQTHLDLAVRQAEIELEFATGWEAPR